MLEIRTFRIRKGFLNLTDDCVSFDHFYRFCAMAITEGDSPSDSDRSLTLDKVCPLFHRFNEEHSISDTGIYFYVEH
jgi:hypothetical protein